MSKRGLGNNPLSPTPAPAVAVDELIRNTAPESGAEAERAPQSPSPQTPGSAGTGKMVAKSVQLDALLNERLRRFAFETHKKEAHVIREALHAWLAAKGF